MKEAIEFIKHAVVNKQFDEQLTQIHACGDSIQSFNGVVTMSHPLPKIGKFSVTSTKLLNAIKACNYEPNIKLTAKSVIVTKANFRAVLPYDASYQLTKQPKGKYKKLKEDVLGSIQILFPFISDDASRTWSQSMMAKEGYLYVTNNITVARVKTTLKDCVLPFPLLAVMLKVKRIPLKVLNHNNIITIDYGDGVWISSRTTADKWPDVDAVFNGLKFKKLPPFSETFKESFEILAPFCEDDTIRIQKNIMAAGETTVKEVNTPDCAFISSNMKRILTTFTHVNFKPYPNPMPISAEGIEGAFVGVVM